MDFILENAEYLIFLLQLLVAFLSSGFLVNAIGKTKAFFGWGGKRVQFIALVWAVLWAVAESALTYVLEPTAVSPEQLMMLVVFIAAAVERHYQMIKDAVGEPAAGE